MSRSIRLCSICSLSVGGCSEDCAFCTQSVHHGAEVECFSMKPLEKVQEEARAAVANGSLGFCLVSSGKSLDDRKLEFFSRYAYAISAEFPHINLIACAGIAGKEALKELKKSGVKTYNHNLETSQEFYPTICSTMSWSERFETCLNVKEAGLNLCSGGIFGVGESSKDRESLFIALKSLSPRSVPINFYHPNPSLPLPATILSRDEALGIIREASRFLEDCTLMSAGGRIPIFGDEIASLADAGIGALVVGDYLTTKGGVVSKDIDNIRKLGIKIATRME